jgi:hypothetical protein
MNRSLAKAHEGVNAPFASEPQKSKPVLRVGQLSIVCFPAKLPDFWTHAILLLNFGLGYDDK